MSSFSLRFLFHNGFETGSHIVLSVCLKVCVCVCTHVCTLRACGGSPSLVLVLVFHFVWDRVSYLPLHMLGYLTQAARDLPITASYLAIEVLGLQMSTLVSSFMGILIYPLKHLSSLTFTSF